MEKIGTDRPSKEWFSLEEDAIDLEKKRLQVEKLKAEIAEAKASNVRRKLILYFLLGAYGFLLVATVVVIFLQGFQVFDLDQNFLNWLGAATVGEVAGLFAMVIKASFRISEDQE